MFCGVGGGGGCTVLKKEKKNDRLDAEYLVKNEEDTLVEYVM